MGGVEMTAGLAGLIRSAAALDAEQVAGQERGEVIDRAGFRTNWMHYGSGRRRAPAMVTQSRLLVDDCRCWR
jgi:hypothetical protein